VSYRYSFEALLALLHGPLGKVDAVALHRRPVEAWHICSGPDSKSTVCATASQFLLSWKVLEGAPTKFLDVKTKNTPTPRGLVTAPVGSARSAILLLECIEH